MKVLHIYDTQIKEWKHEPVERFIGANRNYSPAYSFGISPEDPNNIGCYYFNVAVIKIIENQTNGEVFKAFTQSTFLVHLGSKTPTAQFYFSLAEIAGNNFAAVFYQKVKDTDLQHEKIPKPRIDNLRDDIQKTIDIWGKTLRNTSPN